MAKLNAETCFLPRDENGKIIGGPGRTKGVVSGRARALSLVDKILGNSKNIKKLEESLQQYFDDNPTKFFMAIAVPLMPHNFSLDINTNHDLPQVEERDVDIILQTFYAGFKYVKYANDKKIENIGGGNTEITK